MASPKVGSSRAERTRAKLREAAVQAMSARGFHGTTTRDIATAAGLSTAALYVHYASKEEMLYAISKDGHEETLRIVRAAAASSSDPVQQLRALVHEYVVYHAREHVSAIIVNRELAALEPAHLAHIRALRSDIEKTAEDVLRAGAASGAFQIDDVRITMIAVMSLGLDVARWYHDTGEWTPEDVAARYTQLVLRLVGVSPVDH